MSAPIEVTTRFVTTVAELTDAWAFIMSRADLVGDNPEISIKPRWITSIGEALSGSDERPPREFEVVVAGMTVEDTEGNDK